MDVRGRRLRKQSDEATAFISSMASDGRIAAQTIKVNLAHTVSLTESGEVKRSVGARCLRFLRSAPAAVPGHAVAEDFHQFLEQRAVDSLGVEVAGYLNLGKSRNDQVATAIRMELRQELLDLADGVIGLQRALLSLARRHGGAVFPGYTHLQRAQPVTAAHYAFAHFDAFGRDLDRIFEAYPRVNVSPMGSAALGGTSVRVDRALVAELLGFRGIAANSMDGVSSRDVVVEALSTLTILMLDVSRLCEEVVLWSSKEFGFIELADEYSASSSIMPQKKNPVMAELARAKAGSVLGALVAVCAILKALPYSYNLDLQEATPHLWAALDDASESVSVLTGMVKTMKVNTAVVAASVRGDYSTATALANYLVEEHGISFRQAHAIVGELVGLSIGSGSPLEEVAAKELPRVSSRLAKRVSLSKDKAAQVLDPVDFLGGIVTEGGANPSSIPEGLSSRTAKTAKGARRASSLRRALERSDRRLNARVGSITGEVKS